MNRSQRSTECLLLRAEESHGARFRIYLLLNITPDIRFGQENKIDISGSNWHTNFPFKMATSNP